MTDDEGSQFENMRLEVLREVDQIRSDIEQSVSDVNTEVTEIRSDVKNLRWFVGIAFTALFAVFSLIVAIMAYLANII